MKSQYLLEYLFLFYFMYKANHDFLWFIFTTIFFALFNAK
jgi:hypothetical protein